MSKVAIKKKVVVEDKASVLSDAKVYARKIWLAGLGAYAKAGQEGAEYLKDLIKAGETVEQKGKKIVDQQVDAANSQIDSAKSSVRSNVSSVKGKVELQLDKIEKAFDTRVASALNRIGIPSKQDIDVLSAKLDELSALLDHVSRTK
ncbi:phasin family protein [Pseudomonas segetis]|uniref:Poly(Hydroxyalkanoate) granule-associated protein n=1 Tax=Pseudomonas segetis TaxID=298908 RepID=A0A239DPR4_9PSED|nr:phasin family protein [Pseudomonas segetis]SNS34506.1 poly(hydroxyalkanoate) granule-associated protein [Pseudomonas segetis]